MGSICSAPWLTCVLVIKVGKGPAPAVRLFSFPVVLPSPHLLALGRGCTAAVQRPGQARALLLPAASVSRSRLLLGYELSLLFMPKAHARRSEFCQCARVCNVCVCADVHVRAHMSIKRTVGLSCVLQRPRLLPLPSRPLSPWRLSGLHSFSTLTSRASEVQPPSHAPCGPSTDSQLMSHESLGAQPDGHLTARLPVHPNLVIPMSLAFKPCDPHEPCVQALPPVQPVQPPGWPL